MNSGTGEKTKTAPTPAVDFNPPLKPHKKTLILLSVLFTAWVIFLLILYFKTTYPLRHS